MPRRACCSRSSLRCHDFGTDEDGDPITVNIVSSETVDATRSPPQRERKLKPNQQTVFAILHSAGSAGLSLEDWNNQAKDAGIGIKRKADLTDIRNALQSKGMVRNYGDRWHVVHESRFRWFVGYGSYREPNRTEPRTLKSEPEPNPNRTYELREHDVNETERE